MAKDRIGQREADVNYAIGYERVSDDKQVETGISLEMQRAKIRAYCELNDLELVGFYGDPGISGKDIKHRPGMQAVMDMVRRKRINHVVIYKLDRMARNTIETLQIAEDMNKFGVGLHSITEKLDTKSAIGRFFFTLMASLGEMERRQIAERTSAALQHKKSKGEQVSRFPPAGHKFVEDRIEERNGKQKVIRKVVTWDKGQEAITLARDLVEQGMSLRQTARELTKRGYRTTSGKPYSHHAVNMMIKAAA